MKKSGFKPPSPQKLKELQERKYAKAVEKRAATIAKAREKVPKAKGIGKAPKKSLKAPKRAKLPSVKTMRNKCDALLTPIIKKMYPYCIFTGEETQVAHHAIKKSTSSALRYYLPNLIPLTHKAHMRLHADEILWTGKLIELKGMDWWKDLMNKKEVYTKCDVHHYIAEYSRLKALLDSLD